MRQPKQAPRPCVLVITSTFPRWHNDTEPRFVYDLCRRLRSSFDVRVLTQHHAGAKTEETMDGLQVRRYRYAPDFLENLGADGGIAVTLKRNNLYWLLVPVFLIAQLIAIRKLCKRFEVNCIHAHWLIPQGFTAVLSQSGNSKPIPVLCTSHGGDLFGFGGKLGTWMKRYTISRIQKLTVVSSAMQRVVTNLSPGSHPGIEVIPMGTELGTRFVPNSDVNRDPCKLLFAGRLVEKKGVQYAIRAMPRVLEKFPNSLLHIAGSGPEQNALRQLSRQLELDQSVIFRGPLDHSQLAGEFQTAALSVFPFVQAKSGDMEGLGLVVVEALGCECPVVASSLPAIGDMIDNHKSGILVEPRDQTALADAIIQLLDDPVLARQYAQWGRQKILDRFDWNTTTRKYTAALHSILEQDS